MNAKFVSLRWIKGEPAHLVQGIKGNKTPKNALKGSNGSFIVAGSPTEIILTVELENGNVCRYDIYRYKSQYQNYQKRENKFYQFRHPKSPILIVNIFHFTNHIFYSI